MTRVREIDKYCELVVDTDSQEETVRMGSVLGRGARPGQVFALEGDLGTGKTTLARGICQGLDSHDPVNSPSFPIMNIYRGRVMIYHFDFYRLGSRTNWLELGLDEYFYDEGVCLIEWPDRIPDFLPEQVIQVHLQRPDQAAESRRRITIRYPEGAELDLAKGSADFGIRFDTGLSLDG